MRLNSLFRDKKGEVSMPQEFTGWYIFGIVCLFVAVLVILGVKGKLVDTMEYFRSLMRFGRG